ncbi:hypothetical protein pkur_cds_225 [Pandoravirus kuranda]|uniref:Uncharacterized protein n=1 Tax=Pandoravirus kuranda TaxID=3019033 RepID=A0AA95J6H5_9VIRU|nr:hypothetical protein pkur_cds_225 [Pandoravirus kuranda]
MDKPTATIDSARGTGRASSHKRAQETVPVLIDLSSDDDVDVDCARQAANEVRPHASARGTAYRGAPLGDGGRAVVRAPARYAYDPDDSDEQETDDDDHDDDRSDVDDVQDSDDSDDDGSDLKDFIVSDDDDDDDSEGEGRPNGCGAVGRGADSEADFVPSESEDDDEEDDQNDDGDDDDAVTLTDDDKEEEEGCNDSNSSNGVIGDEDGADTSDGGSSDQAAISQGAVATAGSERHRAKKGKAARTDAKTAKRSGTGNSSSVCVGKRRDAGDADGAPSAAGTRPTKRVRLDESEVPAIDPTNIVSGKRTRRTTERYMDRHFMEFMVRDVPANQIAAVFDDEDEYFQSGISLTDSSEEGSDGDDSDGGAIEREDDLDSSDYEALDALSSSARPRSRRRTEHGWVPDAGAHSLPGGVGAATATTDATIDLSRPPSTVAALLRSLAAQPGGLRPSVASPRSAPTARTPLLP